MTPPAPPRNLDDVLSVRGLSLSMKPWRKMTCLEEVRDMFKEDYSEVIKGAMNDEI